MEKNPTWMCVVALALRGTDGRWLMHRRPENKDHAGLWEFPGGKVENGETPAFALVREIEEELGIRLDPSELKPVTFAEGTTESSGRSIVILLYTCAFEGHLPTSIEGGETGWFDADRIMKLPRPPLDIILCDRLFAGTET